MTLGKQGRPITGRPPCFLIDTSSITDFVAEYERHKGLFDDHIARSIPGYHDVKAIIGAALVRTFPERASMLDIGASEGSLIKAISALSEGRIQTVGLDPNYAMVEQFLKSGHVEGASYVAEAFCTTVEWRGEYAWSEPAYITITRGENDCECVPNPYAGKEYRYYTPDTTFTIIYAAMTFQFISDERTAHVSSVKSMLSKGGLFIIQEKLFTINDDEYKRNERRKDCYKALSFSDADIRRKAAEVLGDRSKVRNDVKIRMAASMIYVDELEGILCEQFCAVAQFWDAGNFKGYAASDDLSVLARFLANLVPTETEFATIQTPRWIKSVN